jgi:DNA-binding MarR family transcriptional regulator
MAEEQTQETPSQSENGATTTEIPKLAELVTQFVRAYLNNAYSDKLRPTQWEVLRFLSEASEDERTVSGVARHQRTTLGTASITITALERRGLVRRGKRRRAQPLSLTDEGWAMLARDPIARLENVLGTLDEEQRRVLEDAVNRGITALDQESEEFKKAS